MSWGKRIRAAREAQKLSREQLARRMSMYLSDGRNIGSRSIVSWEEESKEPKLTHAIALAKALGYHNMSDLFSEDEGGQLNLEGLNRLEEYRQMLLLLDRFREQPARTTRLLPVYLQPASAGTGQWLDDDACEEIEVDESVPASAEFGVRLAGNSMEPRFADGQIVWVRRSGSAESGQIILCWCDGQAYCKKLLRNDKGIWLISLNSQYQPIAVTPESDFRVFGVIVA